MIDAGELDALRHEMTERILRVVGSLEAERQARAAAEVRIAELERAMDTRGAECQSLQHTVAMLSRSVDQLTALVEDTVPRPGSRAATDRSARKLPSPVRSTRTSSPGLNGQSLRTNSPMQRGRQTGRPTSPMKRAQSAGRLPGSGSPLNLVDIRAPLSTRLLKKGVAPRGAAPVISAPGRGGTQRGATAVREIHADYVAGLRHPPFLRSCVFPPEGMEDLQSRPSQLPSAKLELTTIFGCSVDGYHSNMEYAGDAGCPLAVYCAAAVGVTMDTRTRKQSFCFHHNDEVTCVAVHPTRRRLVATGQRGQRGTNRPPCVCVWAVDTLARMASLRDFHDGEVVCADFSPDGELLATIGADPHHTLALYRWEREQLLAHARVSGEPVYGALFNPFNARALVTFGRKFIKFWDVVPSGGADVTLRSRAGQLGGSFSLAQHRVVSGAWIDSRVCVVGTDAGALLVWSDESLINVYNDVHAGGVSSVRAVALSGDNPLRNDALVTGGRDGRLLMWSGAACVELCSGGSHGLPRSKQCDIAELLLELNGEAERTHSGDAPTVAAAEQTLRLVTGGRAPVRSLATRVTRTADDTAPSLHVLAMIFSNQILEVDLSKAFGGMTGALRLLHQGPSSLPTASLSVHGDSEGGDDVCFECVCTASAAHPHAPLMATVGSDSVLRFWRDRGDGEWMLCHVAQLHGRGSAVDFSPNGRLLAVGMEVKGDAQGGGCMLFQVDAAGDGQVLSCEPCARLEESAGAECFVVRFDPSGQLLAVGGTHNRVDVYDVGTPASAGAARRVAATRGHAQAVCRLDWAADGSAIQTDDLTPEHLYFNRDGSRITKPIQMRNTAWASWTCAYGWHVQGIWDERMDQHSISTVSLSPDGDLCTTSDADGNVSLFAFPAPMQTASHKKYRGHSRRSTSVTFSRAAPVVFSTAADGCVFVWKVVRDRP
eukprot:TRINITY_DN28405_c0_g1_i1.p1 TRINITY_DN28405_c0_g1~~TRINITY_DN28405_c0_g1_i1.p1  ORF type:complete len:941 (+),score=297.15 TRINITY_DN28405_c0_g1_i1:111-2933(+)